MNIGLVYVGRILALDKIENADYIVCATVVCGIGGKWRGVVTKGIYEIGNKCIVYLPDACIPESEEMAFMKSSNWRVKMRRFRGAPSEVVIMPFFPGYLGYEINIGEDMTEQFGVTKYHKPVPANLQGKATGDFPSFIPKTDEPNYQNSQGQSYIEMLQDMPFYITEKADGSSTTAFKYKDEFGVCSRNWQLEKDENNGYWQIAMRYSLEEKLPEGIAIQWETCGPKIQNNPMGLKEIQGFIFSGYNIIESRYLTYFELSSLSIFLDFPMVCTVQKGTSFSSDGIEILGEGTYSNGKQREGIVARSIDNLLGHKPISFKVINLNYEK